MGIHNLEGALMAKELGFKRIVLSRECRIEDIVMALNKSMPKYTASAPEYTAALSDAALPAGARSSIYGS